LVVNIVFLPIIVISWSYPFPNRIGHEHRHLDPCRHRRVTFEGDLQDPMKEDVGFEARITVVHRAFPKEINKLKRFE
jgi:hypothetical protein